MTKAPEVNPAPNPFDPAALRSDHRQDFVRVHSPSAFSIVDIATEAAARLNLTRGRDNKWRGRCPACGYDKPTLEVAVEQDRIAVSCNACGALPVSRPRWASPPTLSCAECGPSKVARALDAWRKASPAAGSLVERYCRAEG